VNIDTHWLSYGAIKVAPVCCCTCAQTTSRACALLAQVITVAPYVFSTALRFTDGAFSGITTYAGMPRNLAARAIA